MGMTGIGGGGWRRRAEDGGMIGFKRRELLRPGKMRVRGKQKKREHVEKTKKVDVNHGERKKNVFRLMQFTHRHTHTHTSIRHRHLHIHKQLFVSVASTVAKPVFHLVHLYQ